MISGIETGIFDRYEQGDWQYLFNAEEEATLVERYSFRKLRHEQSAAALIRIGGGFHSLLPFRRIRAELRKLNPDSYGVWCWPTCYNPRLIVPLGTMRPARFTIRRIPHLRKWWKRLALRFGACVPRLAVLLQGELAVVWHGGISK